MHDQLFDTLKMLSGRPQTLPLHKWKTSLSHKNLGHKCKKAVIIFLQHACPPEVDMAQNWNKKHQLPGCEPSAGDVPPLRAVLQEGARPLSKRALIFLSSRLGDPERQHVRWKKDTNIVILKTKRTGIKKKPKVFWGTCCSKKR